jgi:hypothetical protein
MDSTDKKDPANGTFYIARSLMRAWHLYDTVGKPTLILPIAFSNLRYNRPYWDTEPMDALITACMPIHNLLKPYTGSPPPDIEALIREHLAEWVAQIAIAIQPFAEFNWFEAIKPTDPWKGSIKPYYDLLYGFSLLAFSLDSQSIHRSETQTMMMENLKQIQAIPLPKDMEALIEFLDTQKDGLSSTFFDDYASLNIDISTGKIVYSEVFDHVWAYIRNHKNKVDLVGRLKEEILDGIGKCPNGKLCRLMNVVEGYLEGVSTASQKELFQNRMAVISEMASGKIEEATKAFKEYGIQKEEQQAWLDALLA